VALVGVNGAGKSTLIRMLAGTEPLTAGEFTVGHNVETEYFAQDQYKELDPAVRLLDDLGNLSPRSTLTELRTLLGCFLFSEEDVFKPVGVLSGGERNRYALARLLLHPSNFLLLDEPTNHLDLRAKDVLLDSLQEFTGTLVFVSHDRYFIDKLATRIFDVAGGEVRVYPGNYEDYLWRKSAQAAATEPSIAAAEAPAGASGAAPESKAKRLNPIRLRQMRERCQALEEDVARREAEIAELERALADFKSVEETVRLNNALEAARKDLAALLAEWEDLSQAIEDAGAA
jgi:ATP-binding cassette subfamily F protein 3